MDKLGYLVESERDFNEVAALLDKTVPEHGFKVLAIHNVQETLAAKGFRIEPLKIYEVCNAGFAYKALHNDINVALFMPCKIVIRPEKGKTKITLVRPSMIAEMLPASDLTDLANEVERQLIEIIDEIK
jgi:uncharacterized protein (DUF302 family)